MISEFVWVSSSFVVVLDATVETWTMYCPPAGSPSGRRTRKRVRMDDPPPLLRRRGRNVCSTTCVFVCACSESLSLFFILNEDRGRRLYHVVNGHSVYLIIPTLAGLAPLLLSSLSEGVSTWNPLRRVLAGARKRLSWFLGAHG